MTSSTRPRQNETLAQKQRVLRLKHISTGYTHIEDDAPKSISIKPANIKIYSLQSLGNEI